MRTHVPNVMSHSSWETARTALIKQAQDCAKFCDTLQAPDSAPCFSPPNSVSGILTYTVQAIRLIFLLGAGPNDFKATSGGILEQAKHCTTFCVTLFEVEKHQILLHVFLHPILCHFYSHAQHD